MDRNYPTWILVIFIVFLIIVLMFIIACIAKHTALPLSGGSIGSGEIAAKTMRWHKTEKNDYGLVAVIVEYKVENLEERIENYIRVLPKNTHFQVYHTAKQADILHQSKIGKYIGKNKVELMNMGVEKLTDMGYAKLLCSIDFWHSIRAEKVLLCQCECKNKSLKVENLLKYDFVGKPYSKHTNTGWRALFGIKGWNINTIFLDGDLSLRSKSKCIEVLEKYPWDEKTPENIWFSAFLPRVNGRLPSYHVAKNLW